MPRKVRIFLAILFLLCGAGIFFYPNLRALYSDWKTKQAVAAIQQMQATQPPTEPPVTTAPTEPPATDTPTQPPTEPPTAPPETQPSEMDLLYRELVAYNEQIYAEGQANLRDPFSYETPAIDLTQYGFEDDLIGVLWIPRMDVELPLYLGATWSHMSDGAVVLGETSIPVSGENTNVVVAAHRGWNGTAKFRDIQLLQIGDKITITTPWEKLTYRVCELKIISPDAVSEVLIQPGRELLTLLTCHPYTQNYQRYMVIAERSREEPEQTRQEELEEAEKTFDEKPRPVQVQDEDGKTAVIPVDPVRVAPASNEGGDTGAAYSNLQILLEKYAQIVMLALLAVLTIVLLVRKRRKSNRE